MRYAFLPALLLLLSCTADFSPQRPRDAIGDLRLEAARQELERLNSSQFGDADRFLLPFDTVLRDLSVKPITWSYWKEHLNYREDDIPQGTIVYGGAPEIDYTLGRSIKRKGVIHHQWEHLSFSKNGLLLAHVGLDSLLCYYDADNRLRQTSSYSSSSDGHESIRLFDYDAHGNLRSYAVFFENEAGRYLNHYNAYSYMTCDSGTYAKEVHFMSGRKNSPRWSRIVTYSFFDKAQTLRRKFQTFAMGATGVTFYDYKPFNGKLYLVHEQMQNILGTDQPVVDSYERDHLNRMTFVEHRSRFGRQRDSTVYVHENEVHFYHYKSDYYIHDLTKTKFDAHGNPIHRERFEFQTLKDIRPLQRDKISYELLPNGTWYTSHTQQTALDKNSGLSGDEYSYREFLDHPVEAFDCSYKEDPKLIEMIEQAIPSEFLQRK